MSKLSVILINYNQFGLTSNCIRSILQHTKDIDYELILVDNASVECDPGKFLEEFPGLVLVRNNRNLGFAGGNNSGIEYAKGDHILLLNNDTLLTENSFLKSLQHFQKDASAGVLGCRMVYADGAVQYSARRFRSIQWELLDLFRFIPYLLPYPKRSALMLGRYFRHDEDREVDWVNGAYFLFSRKVLEQLPEKKLDNRFFMYGEDQLWCEQISKLAYKVLFYAGTTITHLHAASTARSKQIQLRKTLMRRELEIMRIRKGRGVYYFFYKLIYGTKESISILIKSIVFRTSGKLVR